MWPSLPVANHIADVANWFFIGSLVVGVVSTILIVWMAGVKEAYWEKDRTESAERIASLVTQGEQLRMDTAQANARAAEAQLALEKFKAPRRLSTEQQSTIVDKIRKFSGQKFDMALNSADPEAAALQLVIENMLTLAGWQQVDWRGGDLVFTRPPRPVIGIITMVGVFAQMERDKAPAFEAGVVTLVGALNLEGIAAKAEAGSIPMADNKDVIHIMIGKKP